MNPLTLNNLSERKKIKGDSFSASMVSHPLVGHSGVIIGIDPGVNFGMTVIIDEKVDIYHGKLTKCEQRLEYAGMSMTCVREIMDNYPAYDTPLAVLEGAAFNKTFGQVGLAEVRAGFYLGLKYITDMVTVVPPMTTRKKVFGDGRTQPMDVWPTLNHNAADSLSLALYLLS